VVTVLTAVALIVQGYHPYAEDGGLYVAGIKKLLDPGLYAGHAEFVMAPLRYSPFAPVLAAVTRWSHLPLPWVLLLVYAASIWATLYGGWMLASRCTDSPAGRVGAVTLLGCWLTMPIAGTALLLLDPYVTARSFSTPLVLMALAWGMDARRGNPWAGVRCALALGLAAIHPLMAGYGLAALVALLIVGSDRSWVRRWGAVTLLVFGLVAASAMQAFAPSESAAFVRAELTRQYWFPQAWTWYEQAGLLAPLLMLLLLGRVNQGWAAGTLIRSMLLVASASLLVAGAFVRSGLSIHLVARMQPLRTFQLVYEILFLLLGAWLGDRLLRHKRMVWAGLMVACGGVMFYAELQTYPNSRHIELPWLAPQNNWVEAFEWIRSNSPRDTLFALDSNYITREGEDAQGFRGIAERSALADYSKDGGEAAIAPALAEMWLQGQAAQHELDAAGDAMRMERLKPLGVTGVILGANAATAWKCPYDNGTVKVCGLP
jgi:hypothetical protein